MAVMTMVTGQVQYTNDLAVEDVAEQAFQTESDYREKYDVLVRYAACMIEQGSGDLGQHQPLKVLVHYQESRFVRRLQARSV